MVNHVFLASRVVENYAQSYECCGISTQSMNCIQYYTLLPLIQTAQAYIYVVPKHNIFVVFIDATATQNRITVIAISANQDIRGLAGNDLGYTRCILLGFTWTCQKNLVIGNGDKRQEGGQFHGM